jgi:tetratricopeptide (TPR) repeat protein
MRTMHFDRRRLVPLVVAVFMILAAAAAGAQVTSDFSVTASPGVNIPLGPALADGTAFYSIGGGISIKADYTMPFAQFLYAGVDLDADLLPIYNSQKSLTLLSFGPEVGVQFFPFQRFGIRVAAMGGMYAGMVEAGTVLNPWVGGMLDFSYLVSPSFSIGLGTSYKYTFTDTSTIYTGLGVSIGARYNIGAGSGSGIIKIEPDVAPIFPLFYSYYDKNAAGVLKISNTGSAAVQDVQVSFYVKQFMDQPKLAWQGKELARGQEVSAWVYALFTDRIFSVVEETKVAGEIQVSYKYLGQDVNTSYPVSVVVRNRNAMTWDDTSKAAAFVTTNDPWVRSFSARAVPDARSKGRMAVNATFRAAMSLFDAMNVHGVAYLPDPVTFASKVAKQDAVDYLQFPAQTLEIKAGDCDDLSILYTALLESAGIETAFITVPGHIYMAFNLGMDPRQATAVFGGDANLIIRDNATWIPVEITKVKDGFVKAWQVGAQEWKNATSSNNAAFFPLRPAWSKYAPANTGDIIKTPVLPPDSSKIYEAYTKELQGLYDDNVQPRAKALTDALKTRKNDLKLLNSLGVLYARFGMYPEARTQFEQVVKIGGDIPPALINIGNIEYLAGRNESAFGYFQRALAKAPKNSAALQGVALTGYELGRKDEVNVALEALKHTDPDAADRLASLGTNANSSGRAASADKEITSWTDAE